MLPCHRAQHFAAAPDVLIGRGVADAEMGVLPAEDCAGHAQQVLIQSRLDKLRAVLEALRAG